MFRRPRCVHSCILTLSRTVRWIVDNVCVDAEMYATAVDLKIVVEEVYVVSAEPANFERRTLDVVVRDVVTFSTSGILALRGGLGLLRPFVEDVRVRTELVQRTSPAAHSSKSIVGVRAANWQRGHCGVELLVGLEPAQCTTRRAPAAIYQLIIIIIIIIIYLHTHHNSAITEEAE